MFFDQLEETWRKYKEGMEREIQVLVVDDEPVICRILREALEREGYWVETVLDAEAAWERIEAHPFDLLVADKNLPGRSGLELIRQVRDAGIDLPSIVITAYASVEGISKALMNGAEDYIQKPFRLATVMHRINAIVERRVGARVYSLIIQDLSSAVKSAGEERSTVRAIAAELGRFKDALSRRPSVLLVEPNAALAELSVGAIGMQGLTVEQCVDLDTARELLMRPDGPLLAVVNLRLDGVPEFIEEVRAMDPLMEIFVTSTGADLDRAQQVVDVGASDFFERTVEGTDVLQVRIFRLFRKARRERLYAHLISTLQRAAQARSHPLAQTLQALVPQHSITPSSEGTDAAAASAPAPQAGAPAWGDLVPEDAVTRPAWAPAPRDAAAPASDVSAALSDAAPASSDMAASANAAGPTLDDADGDADGDAIDISELFEEPVDRRQHPRLPASFTVRLHDLREDRFTLGQTEDISLGGMFVVCQSAPPLGSRVLVELLPAGADQPESISVSAEVVRYVEVESQDGATGLGLRVLGQLDNYHAAVCRLMEG